MAECYKRSFDTKQDAHAAYRNTYNYRVYRCVNCGKFHTSSTLRPGQRERGRRRRG